MKTSGYRGITPFSSRLPSGFRVMHVPVPESIFNLAKAEAYLSGLRSTVFIAEPDWTLALRLDQISLRCIVVSAVAEVALAFLGWEVVEGLSEEVPEVVNRAVAGGAEQAFEF